MKETIQSYLEHATDSIEAATILLANYHLLAVANRTYYAVFYCVSALLLPQGITTKKHEGARVKFHELFIKTGLFSREAGIILERTFEARQSADYDMGTTLSKAQAQELLSGAAHFYRLTVDFFQKNPVD